MASRSRSTHDDLLTELNRDPKFRKEYQRQAPYYAFVVKIIRLRSRLMNLVQKLPRIEADGATEETAD
jgi:hypothetical protein